MPMTRPYQLERPRSVTRGRPQVKHSPIVGVELRFREAERALQRVCRQLSELKVDDRVSCIWVLQNTGERRSSKSVRRQKLRF